MANKPAKVRNLEDAMANYIQAMVSNNQEVDRLYLVLGDWQILDEYYEDWDSTFQGYPIQVHKP